VVRRRRLRRHADRHRLRGPRRAAEVQPAGGRGHGDPVRRVGRPVDDRRAPAVAPGPHLSRQGLAGLHDGLPGGSDEADGRHPALLVGPGRARGSARRSGVAAIDVAEGRRVEQRAVQRGVERRALVGGPTTHLDPGQHLVPARVGGLAHRLEVPAGDLGAHVSLGGVGAHVGDRNTCRPRSGRSPDTPGSRAQRDPKAIAMTMPRRRELPRDAQERTPTPPVLADPPRADLGGLRLHRGLLQPDPTPLDARDAFAAGLRRQHALDARCESSPLRGSRTYPVRSSNSFYESPTLSGEAGELRRWTPGWHGRAAPGSSRSESSPGRSPISAPGSKPRSSAGSPTPASKRSTPRSA
jgi:hypothetical protein